MQQFKLTDSEDYKNWHNSPKQIAARMLGRVVGFDGRITLLSQSIGWGTNIGIVHGKLDFEISIFLNDKLTFGVLHTCAGSATTVFSQTSTQNKDCKLCAEEAERNISAMTDAFLSVMGRKFVTDEDEDDMELVTADPLPDEPKPGTLGSWP